ncbi:hypothetical protein ACFX2I_044868 [Malus domestica]
MGSGNGVYSVGDFDLDAKWLIDRKHLLYKNQNVAVKNVHRGETPEQIAKREARGLKESDVDSFVDEVLVNHKPWASGVQEALTGSHVVYVHMVSR